MTPEDIQQLWDDLRTRGWEEDAHPDAKNSQDEIPLMHALEADPAAFAWLLAHTKDPTHQDAGGWSVLHHLAFVVGLLSDDALIERLVGHIPVLAGAGLDVSLQDKDGNTPLMVGIESPPMVAALLRNGANPFLENNAGETALGLALDAKAVDTIRLLKPFLEQRSLDDTLPAAHPHRPATRL